MLKLREQLLEVEKERQQLLERVDGVPSNSPSSSQSQSMEAVDPPFLGEFGVVDGYDDNVFNVPETQYLNGMEWINLFM